MQCYPRQAQASRLGPAPSATGLLADVASVSKDSAAIALRPVDIAATPAMANKETRNLLDRMT
jgi:hypothetical protein